MCAEPIGTELDIEISRCDQMGELSVLTILLYDYSIVFFHNLATIHLIIRIQCDPLQVACAAYIYITFPASHELVIQ